MGVELLGVFPQDAYELCIFVLLRGLTLGGTFVFDDFFFHGNLLSNVLHPLIVHNPFCTFYEEVYH